MNALQRARHAVIERDRRFDGSHSENLLSSFSFKLLSLFFLRFDPDIDRGDDERPLTSRERQKFVRQNVQFVKTIVSDIRFTIVFLYEFFAASTSSSRSVSKPHIS